LGFSSLRLSGLEVSHQIIIDNRDTEAPERIFEDARLNTLRHNAKVDGREGRATRRGHTAGATRHAGLSPRSIEVVGHLELCLEDDVMQRHLVLALTLVFQPLSEHHLTMTPMLSF
jgi:hypothetical protein